MKKIFTAVCVMALVCTSIFAQSTAKDVIKTANGYLLVTAEGDTVRFDRKNSNDVSFEQKQAVLAGQARAVDPRHRDVENQNRHGVTVALLAGANLADGNVNPIGTLRLGYQTCHFVFEVEGSISSLRRPETAEYRDVYASGVFSGNVGLKVYQSVRHRSYVAIFGTAGVQYHESDAEQATFSTANYGLTCGAGVRGSWAVGDNLSIIAEASGNLFPKVLDNGGTQEFSNWGPQARVGVQWTF